MPLYGDAKREYQKKWIAARRDSFFKGKSCVMCGSTERLELDHIDPTTKVSHRIWSYSKSRQLEELAKCQILCYTCHKEKTNKPFGDQFQIKATTSKSLVCRYGHDLSLTGAGYRSESTIRYCGYCHYLSNGSRRNAQSLMSYEEYIEYKKPDN